jgi:hypothetical protein
MSRKNGGIIGPANTPVGGLLTGVAGGVWRMNDVANFVGNSQWPTGPQSIDNSLRFNDGSSDSLTKTSSTGSNTTSTLSVWIKRANLGAEMKMLNFTGGSNNLNIEFKNDDQLSANAYDGSSQFSLKTNRKFRDTSSWYNIIVAIDSTQSTSSNRVKIYVNGVQETSFETSNYPSQDDTLVMNNHLSSNPFIGQNGGGSHYFDGYMAEICWIDGLQLDPTSFGETNTATGIWTPKKLGKLGTVGANTFYLDFKDSSNVGNDASGLNNDFTVNNLTSIDQSIDTCVVNYPTLNPLASSIDTSNNVLKEGNLQVDHGDNNYDGGTATFGFLKNMTGKWYWEIRNNANTGSSNQGEFAGISYIGDSSSTAYDDFGTESYLLATTGSNIIYKKDNSAVWTLTSPSGFSAGDIINVALDLDNSKIWFGLNGTFYDMSDGSTDGDPTGSNGATVSRDYDYLPYFRIYGNTAQLDFNFGSPPFSISSGNSDANGFGNFEYPVPSGYYALNTSNLNTYG